MIIYSNRNIKLSKFSATTHEEFVKALLNLKNKGMIKLVLDLRDNGGGYLQAAIDIADEFLSEDKLIVYTKGVHRPKTTVTSTKEGNFEDGPLVILINEFSASASEIVAGAIQDNDRGTIIGRKSVSKGKEYARIWVYVPTKVSEDTAFPFELIKGQRGIDGFVFIDMAVHKSIKDD